MARRWITAGVIVGGSFALMMIVPAVAGALYVKPNEISLERPYIQTHIEATRAAYGLADHMREIEMHTGRDRAVIDTSKHKPLLDNVRLWDWRPFHDTVTQMQALRPYYAFHDTDVDRYTIDGQYRQILLSPRELDITQLPGDQASWINPHFVYTHGYGLVLAEVSKITSDGQPVYLVQDMPPEVKTPSLKIDRPELYYGELQHEPVFVDTAQEEFDYPKGSDNAKTRYAGKGGFPISSLLMRLAATIDFGDSNIVLTGYLTDNSRMMIHRRIRERLDTLAPYLTWDNDPYLVITSGAGPSGWWTATPRRTRILSRVQSTFTAASTISAIRSKPPSTPTMAKPTSMFSMPPIPSLQHTARTVPSRHCMKTRPACPRISARIRAMRRNFFRVQSGMYSVYHMRNPQAFYNNEDVTRSWPNTARGRTHSRCR